MLAGVGPARRLHDHRDGCLGPGSSGRCAADGGADPAGGPTACRLRNASGRLDPPYGCGIRLIRTSGPVAALAVDATPASTASKTVDPSPGVRQLADHPTCVVVPRDTLWGLAHRHLGDGFRWRELWDLNRGRRQPDGRSMRDPNLIRPGWVVALQTTPSASTTHGRSSGGCRPAADPPSGGRAICRAIEST